MSCTAEIPGVSVCSLLMSAWHSYLTIKSSKIIQNYQILCLYLYAVVYIKPLHILRPCLGCPACRSPTGCLLACDVRVKVLVPKKKSQSFPKSKQLSFAQLYTFHIFPLIQLVHCSCSVHISFHCFSCFFIVLVLFYICTFCLCCILLDNVVLLCSRQQNGCLCSGLILSVAVVPGGFASVN